MSAPKQVVKNIADLQALATRLAHVMKGGDILLLNGELGTGKTTFTKALLHALGIKEEVTSPTFTIVSAYTVTEHPTIRQAAHIDLYRLTAAEIESGAALQEMKESMSSPEQLTIIEWAEKMPLALPAYRLTFHHGETPNERIVAIDPALAVRF
jgi:tRNA threonylcarbamoyladenosine biosynthesis protein TsaE